MLDYDACRPSLVTLVNNGSGAGDAGNQCGVGECVVDACIKEIGEQQVVNLCADLAQLVLVQRGSHQRDVHVGVGLVSAFGTGAVEDDTFNDGV